MIHNAILLLAVWDSGIFISRMNEVTLCWAWLVFGWVISYNWLG